MKSLPIHQITAGLLLAICVSPVCAVKPGKWVNSTEADFAQGKTEATVITNLNQIKLASGTSKLGELPDPLTMVNRVVNLGDKTFLAAGPEGQVLKLAGEKFETLLNLPEHQIFAMTALDKDNLLVAASGEPSRLLALSSSGESRTLVELEGIRYLWDVLVIDGKVYLATGIQGRLLEITLAELEPVTAEASAEEPQTKPAMDKAESTSKSTTDAKPQSSPNSDKSEIQDTKSEIATSTEPAQTQPVYPKGVREIFHAKQNNLLCLGSDGQKRMYLGTDTDGLVYRLTPPKPPATEFEIFVLLDAQEPEIGAILVQADGTVYVGTADANQARPGRMTDATTMPMGRLEEMEDQDAPAQGDAPSVTPKTAPRSPNPGLNHETDQSAKPNASAHESKHGTTLKSHAPGFDP
ncbi:MAG: hypothetical protein HC898_05280 [Phycisphaerales bacterium]|nr:hypothetical protein [Phycisphaerales bacterium]